MLKKSYRMRLIIIFLMITIVPLLFMAVGVTVNLKDYMLGQYNENALYEINHQVEVFEEWIDNKIIVLKNTAEALRLIEDYNNVDEINKYLKGVKENSSEFLNLFFALENGGNYDALNARSKQDVRRREWYKHAKETDGVVISDPYKDSLTGVLTMTISLPLKDSSGRFQGVLGVDIAFDEVLGKLDRIGVLGTSKHIVVNKDGKLIGNDVDTLKENASILEQMNVEKIQQHKGSFISTDYKGQQVLITYVTIPVTNWEIFIFTDVEEFYAPFYRLRFKFGIISLCSLFIMLGAVGFTSRKIAEPMLKLRDAAKDISDGKLDVALEVKYKDELGEVMTAFNHMAATIQNNYQDLDKQAKWLIEGNEQLQEMNIELEASYEQLTATMEQLNESEEKYRLLIENLSDLLWVMDNNGIITYINDQVEVLLGYKKEDIIGKPLDELLISIHPYQQGSNLAKQMLDEDMDKRDLWMIKANGKEYRIMETKTKRIYHQGVLVGVQGIGRNVTEARRMEKEIKRKNDDLTVLYEISTSLTNTLSTVRTDTLLERIVNKVTEMVGVSVCTIRLMEEDKKSLAFKTTSGVLSHIVSREPLHIDKDPVGMAVKEKRIIVMNDYDKKELDSYIQKKVEKNRIKYVAFIPLKLEHEVIGTMSIIGKDRIEQSDLNILEALSNHAAVAIEKARLYEDQKTAYMKTIKALAMAVEAKDTYTQGHSVRVAQYAAMIAKQMGLKDRDIEDIEIAGILHDIGKIGIADQILTKPGRLDKEEFHAIMQHPVIGSKILEPIGLSDDIMTAILFHHKRNDLKGYPPHEDMQELPLYAKIIGVADAFDAMISNRSYKKPMTIHEAMEELKYCSGTQFCPEVVVIMEQIYTKHMEEIERISKI